MIEMMRSKAASWIAKILAFFLILSFAVWGIGDMFRAPTSGEIVAKIGSSEVSSEEFQEQINRLLSIMREQIGQDFNREQAVKLGLVQQTLDELINSHLIKMEANRLGLVANKTLIRQAIYKNKRFRNRRNQFDRLIFQQYLQQKNLPEAKYISNLKQQLVNEKIIRAIQSGTYVPQILLDTIYQYRNEKRVAEVVFIPFLKNAGVKVPNKKEILEFYTQNPDQFSAPEYRQLTVLYLNPEEMSKEITPSEKSIKEEFQYRKDMKTIPELRTLQQILFQKEAIADKFSKLVRSGRPFSKAAQDLNLPKAQILGTLRKRDLPKPIGEKVFILPKGHTSVPIKTSLGWHVLQVNEIKPSEVPTLLSLKKEIMEDLAKEAAVDKIIKITGTLDDALAGGKPIEEAATLIGSGVIKISNVDALGNDLTGKIITSIPKDSKFLNKAFLTPIGETTNLEETLNGGFYVLRVDNIVKPKLRSLNVVKEKAILLWKKNKIFQSTKQKAESIKMLGISSGSLTRAAKQNGLNVKTSKPFSRFNRVSNSVITDALVGPLFSAKLEEILVSPSNKGYSIAKLKRIFPVQNFNDKEKKENLKAMLENNIASEFFVQYSSGLRKQFPVIIDKSVMNTVVAGKLDY